MKKIIFVELILIIAGGLVRHNNQTDIIIPVNGLTAGEYSYSLTHDGEKRSYILYVPELYNNQPTPLVFFFHGGGGNMNQAKIYNWQSKAEEAGYILALPNGASKLPGGGLATWNAGECCAHARDSNSDDVGFVRAMLADIQKKVAVDNSRVYASGISNGGMFSYRLACEMSDTFAAIASIAGTDVTTSCSPSEPISVLHIHALDDTHVLFAGGAGEDAFRDAELVTEFTSVPDTIDKWKSLNNITVAATRTLTVPGAHCDTYGPDDSTQVTLCVTDTGGHSVPGTTGEGGFSKKTPSQAISAADVAWDFFKLHTK